MSARRLLRKSRLATGNPGRQPHALSRMRSALRRLSSCAVSRSRSSPKGRDFDFSPCQSWSGGGKLRVGAPCHGFDGVESRIGVVMPGFGAAGGIYFFFRGGGADFGVDFGCSADG